MKASKGIAQVKDKLIESLPEKNGIGSNGRQALSLTRTKEDMCQVWLNANYDLKRNEGAIRAPPTVAVH